MTVPISLIVYNYDNCVDAKEIIIVEGEMDCLSMCEAGYYNCVSVPNGATEKTINLEYLDNCIELFIS
jgi:twinkle protein